MSILDDANLSIIKNSHPHLAAGLVVRWGSVEFEPYAMKLVFDSRDGQRQGFSIKVISAILGLIQTHHKEHPGKSIPPKSIWDGTT